MDDNTTANVNTTVLQAALKFVDFLSDPTAVRASVEQLFQATTAADAANDRLAAASAALDEKQAAHERQIIAEREAHESQIQADRAQFARLSAAHAATLTQREKVLSEGERQLALDRQDAEAMRVDLRARIAAINAAADPRPMPRVVGDR